MQGNAAEPTLNHASMVLENKESISTFIINKVFPGVYLSKSLPIDDKDVCCGFFDTFDDEFTFFALVAAASL